MSLTRSALLTAGAVFAASLIANAASPKPVPAPKSAISPVSPVKPIKPIKPASSDPVTNPNDNPNTVITPTGLATADTALSYCAQIDRSAAQTYQSGITMITQGHADAEIAAVRSTPDYAKTQAALNELLSKVSFGSGLQACRQFAGATHKPYGVSSPVHTPQFGSF
jgi:hypothetical protein